MRRFGCAVALVAVIAACSSVKNVVVKDVSLDEQQRILGEYKDRPAWTRVVIEDLGEGGSIPRDEKVTIVDVGLHYSGSVTVQTLKRKDRIVQGLEIERPLTKEKIDARMRELFWFEDPVLRHVAYIRKWGKKTARAIMEHHVFVGMTAEAVLESWGKPDEKKVVEVGGATDEQWIYPAGDKKKYIYLRDGKVTKAGD